MATSNLYAQGVDEFRRRKSQNLRKAKDQDQLDLFLKQNGSPEQAMESGSRLRGYAGEKYGSKDMGGSVVHIDDTWIATIMSSMQTFIDIGNYATKNAPESVGAAWWAISLALGAIQNNYALYGLFGSGLTDMTEMMCTIKHYDRLFDEREKKGFRNSEMLQKLFEDIKDTYVAMLDLCFSIHRHLQGSGWAKLRHGFKDVFNAEAPKFRDLIQKLNDKKKNVLESSDAVFKEKSFQQFGDIKDAVKAHVEDLRKFQDKSESFYQKQIEYQQDIMRTLEDVKENMRPRTPWEHAMQRFQAIKRKLNPIENTLDPLYDALDNQLEGTCAWLFTNEVYQSWARSEVNKMLCVTGREGVGKTILLARSFMSLDDARTSNDSLVYLSCGMANNGKQDDRSSPQSLTRIGNTLIYLTHEYATLDDSNPSILEDCNAIFENPKQQKVSEVMKKHGHDDSIPDLVEALTSLARASKKRITIILDAVNRMSDKDQDELFEMLQKLTLPAAMDKSASAGIDNVRRFRFLIGCDSSSKSKFCQQLPEGHQVLDVDTLNRNDLDLKIDFEMRALERWTESQKAEAKTAILAKAGPIFKYVDKVAIPFLMEPFQGSLSMRLKNLPDGMDESYKRALRAKAPNYLQLLKTALSWSLFSARPMKVAEIMDVFGAAYDACTPLEKIEAIPNDRWTRPSSNLELQQIRAAVEPFLEVTQTHNSEFMMEEYKLVFKDESQVRKFCFQPRSPDRASESNKVFACPRCNPLAEEPATIYFSEKDCHLDMAIQCVRHLCDPQFWHDYYGLWSREPTAPLDVEKNDATSADEEQNVKSQTDLTDGKISHDEGEKEKNLQNDAKQSQEDKEEPRNEATEPESQEGLDGYDSDESQDDEDRGEIAFKRKEQQDSQQQEEASTIVDILRYEMSFWYVHIRKAEKLWTHEERRKEPRWATLFAELDRLAFTRPNEWKLCQRMMSIVEQVDAHIPLFQRQPWKPLHIAALLDLTSWAEHLIDKGESLEVTSVDRTPLQAASRGNASDGMLELLLARGADPNGETEKRMPACHSWLFNVASPQAMELFLKHGARFDMKDLVNQWSLLHYFASADNSVETFKVLMSDPTRKPDINARDGEGQTPLHVLLSRREVNQVILKLFLDHGADVNIDDKMSMRPLQSMSASGDPEAMKIILEHVTEINDTDNHGRTALHQAAWSGHLKCVQLLIDNGAIIDSEDKHHRTVLFYACLGTTPENAKIAALLIEKMRSSDASVFDIIKKTARSRTPLQVSAAHGFDDVVSTLLRLIKDCPDSDAQALVNEADGRKGQTPLHCAAFWGHSTSVRLLLEHGADVKLLDKNGKSALALARGQWALSAQKDFEEIISLLVEKDPAVAVDDVELISSAAANGSTRLLKQLHGFQANLNQVDQYGWTPLLLARQFGHTAAEEFLIRVDALPTKWINEPSILKLEDDGSTIICQSQTSEVCISTDLPIPAGHQKFYFEITIRKTENTRSTFAGVAIGFCTIGAAAIEYPGWPARADAPHARSWAYHGDDGLVVSSDGEMKMNDEIRYGAGMTVGCGFNAETRSIWVTKNGQELEEVNGLFKNVRGRLFPIVGTIDAVEIETNFGSRPFKWKAEGSLTEK